jgi:hypothetical protein
VAKGEAEDGGEGLRALEAAERIHDFRPALPIRRKPAPEFGMILKKAPRKKRRG